MGSPKSDSREFLVRLSLLPIKIKHPLSIPYSSITDMYPTVNLKS